MLNGHSGDPVAYGEILRQKDGIKRVSTARQRSYISQVTSSRVVTPSDMKLQAAADNSGEGEKEDSDRLFFEDEEDSIRIRTASEGE